MRSSRLVFLFAICFAAFSIVACSNEPAADTETAAVSDQTQEYSPVETPLPTAAVEVGQTMQGRLQEVDLTNRRVTIKDADGKEEMFLFTGSTEIAGSADAQGLSSRQGSPVTVSYTEQDGVKTALRIEIASQ
jgi:hypothetical protein